MSDALTDEECNRIIVDSFPDKKLVPEHVAHWHEDWRILIRAGYSAGQKAGGDSARLDWVERTNPIIFHKTYVGAQWAIVTDAEADNEVLADTLREAIDAARGNHE